MAKNIKNVKFERKEKIAVKDQLITKIIDNLENNILPWESPFVSSAISPFNFVTKHEYTGYNALFLYIEQEFLATEKGLDKIDPRWVTFKNAESLGYRIKKGEHGTPIDYYSRITKETTNDNNEIEETSRMISKTYIVFNFTQLDEYGTVIEPYKPITFDWQTDEYLDNMINTLGVKIEYDQKSKAYYKYQEDAIHLPPKNQFKSSDDYYTTVFHEIIHWTGSNTRLNRKQINKKLGLEAYAYEELIAELGSLTLKNKLGIKNSAKCINDASAYIDSWLQMIKSDKNLFFNAVKEAGKAVIYITENFPEIINKNNEVKEGIE